ncbi:alpha/beta fold hydrolase [Sphingosinicella sp. CPCC 101087]|uniref:alpha/beta fold hydrolase n=1 Tax=Sphingosinicella sp. CPCC 101087 TaxID=2497754 RepID=UPI0013EB9107|nr:alpha/beta hydrolase [Sphingosinicella sp. CPCC 101087]
MSKRGVLAAIALLVGAAHSIEVDAVTPARAERLTLAPCLVAAESPDRQAPAEESHPARCGTFLVPENRSGEGDRMLPLRVVVLPSRTAQAREPVYILAGGPGQAASESASGYALARYRDDRDVVLMDVRGTGEGHRLDCRLGGSDEDLQAWLEPLFAEGALYARCRAELERIADLTQYTTENAMRDLDELREALGHERIALDGGSYGTRAALVYIRLFPQRVHAAILASLVPVENRAPLFHAAAAQRGFDLVADQCAAEPACRAAFPDVRGDLLAVLERLRKAPATVEVRHPVTDVPERISLGAAAFADALRVMLYSAQTGRRVPLLLSRARAGDLAPFAETALTHSRGMTRSIRLGLLLAFTCSEDVWRIRPEEVARETAGSFIGASRVLGQMAACDGWPRGAVGDDYYRPLRADVPALLVSGAIDPVTPPSWGEVARRSLPNSLHLVMPGAHVPWSECVDAIAAAFLRAGRVEGLDTGCVQAERLPPFELPAPQATP